MSLAYEVGCLKRERNAVVLAHYYVRPEVQDVADYVGDSFGLAKVAANHDARVIVFCGVRFMGESAKLLSPDKTVLLPEPGADCPMAHMIPAQLVERCRDEYGDDLAVVCYVNSTAETKALSDVCVTSSNALNIVSDLPERHILFIPDRNLGSYVASRLPGKHVMWSEGFCPVHEAIDADEIRLAKKTYPKAWVLAHPECNEEVRGLANVLGSTSRLISAAVHAQADTYIVATALGVEHEMLKQARGRERLIVFPKTPVACADMAEVTLDKVRDCLRDMSGAVEIDPELAVRARKPLARMMELA